MSQIRNSKGKSSTPASSLSLSSQPSHLQLYRSEQMGLERAFSNLSSHLLALKDRKIRLLEQIDQLCTQKAALHAETAEIEKAQLRRVGVKRAERERVLLEELNKRALAQETLSQRQQVYRKRHKQSNIQDDYRRASSLLELIKSNVQLEEELRLTRAANREQEGGAFKEIKELLQHKNELTQLNFKSENPKSPHRSPFDLTPSQLRQACQELSEDKRLLVEQVLSQGEFESLTTNELMQRRAEESLEKELLYDSIRQMKGELSTMQAGNGAMERVLANSKG